MPEVGRQSGDPRGAIAIGAVPVQQRAHSNAVAAVSASDAPPLASSTGDNAEAMANDQSNEVLGDDDRAVAQRLIDEVNAFNLKATGIAEFHEMLVVETDGDGELIAGQGSAPSRRTRAP